MSYIVVVAIFQHQVSVLYFLLNLLLLLFGNVFVHYLYVYLQVSSALEFAIAYDAQVFALCVGNTKFGRAF